MVISKPLQKTIPYLSFIIPVKDEEKSIEQLSQEIVKECNNLEKTYEIIFVDDGSVDRTFEVIKDLHKKTIILKRLDTEEISESPLLYQPDLPEQMERLFLPWTEIYKTIHWKSRSF